MKNDEKYSVFCEWTNTFDELYEVGGYKTQCKKLWIFEGTHPDDKGYIHCPYCSKQIKYINSGSKNEN